MPVTAFRRLKLGSPEPKKIRLVRVTVEVFYGELDPEATIAPVGRRNSVTSCLVIPEAELDNAGALPRTYFLTQCDKVFCEIVDTLSAEGAIEA